MLTEYKHKECSIGNKGERCGDSGDNGTNTLFSNDLHSTIVKKDAVTLSYPAKTLLKLLKCKPVQLGDVMELTTTAADLRSLVEELLLNGWIIDRTADDGGTPIYTLHGRTKKYEPAPL